MTAKKHMGPSGTRLCLALGPWHIVSLAAALRCHEARGQGARLANRLVLYGSLSGDAARRRTVEQMAAAMELWEDIRWDNGVLTLKPPPDEWPFAFARYAAALKEKLEVAEADEIWLCHLFHIEHRFVLEAYDRAKVFLYEDGLQFAERVPVAKPRHLLQDWRIVPGLLARGKLREHYRSVRLSTTSPLLLHARRVACSYVFASGLFPAPPPFERTPVVKLDNAPFHDAMRRAEAVLPADALVLPERRPGERVVLALAQPFSSFGFISADKEREICHPIIEQLIAHGWTIWWKNHPRDNRPVAGELEEKHGGERFKRIGDPAGIPVEIMLRRASVDACVSASSSSLFNIHLLYGVPCYTCASRFARLMPPMIERGLDLARATFPDVEEMLVGGGAPASASRGIAAGRAKREVAHEERAQVVVALASAPWQVLMLAAALTEYRRRHRKIPRMRTILLLNDPRHSLWLRAALESLAERLALWDEVIWDGGLLTLKFPDNEWPIDMEKYAAPIKRLLRVDRADELWLSHLYHIEHHCIVETFPDARVVLYEDGLGAAMPGTTPRWRDYRQIVWLAPRLLLRGKLRRHLRSVRLCDWRISRYYAQRVRHRYVYLARRFAPPPPFKRVPVTVINDEVIRDTMRMAREAPLAMRTSRSTDNVGRRDVLFLGQNLHETGVVRWNDEAAVYLAAISELVAKGYRVWWKEHPREASPFWGFLRSRLHEGVLCEIVTWRPAETLLESMRFGAMVSVSSSSLFYTSDIYGVPVYTCAHLLRPVMRPSMPRDAADLVLKNIPPLSSIPPAV